MDVTDDSSLTERQRYWFNHIRACDATGQTSVDYARAHGINVKSLYSARKALAEKGAAPPTPLPPKLPCTQERKGLLLALHPALRPRLPVEADHLAAMAAVGLGRHVCCGAGRSAGSGASRRVGGGSDRRHLKV